VIPASFDYSRAESLEDALDVLADPDTSVLAGGQSLLPLMKLRLARPGRICDIGRLDLRGIDAGETEVRIGALTTWDEIAGSRLGDAPGLAAIAECAASIGDLQVRNRGTIGGGAAHADPSADMPAVLVALGAKLVARSRAGERHIEAADFFLGPFATALEPGELLVEIRVPRPASGAASAYASVEHPASGYALAGAAAVSGPTGSAIVMSAVAGRPIRIASPDDLDGVEPPGDHYASADYRRHLAGVVARRAVARAEARRAA
jgi:carbon-monoxide dehydrogenase medium subunit